MMKQSLLDVTGLSKSFRRGGTHALDNVSFSVTDGSIFGVVGESGSGKSTLVRCLVRLERPDRSQILFDQMSVDTLRGRSLRTFRREVQFIGQDPYASLDPRMTVEQIVAEGITLHGLVRDRTQRRERVAEVLAEVGLDDALMSRLPAALSGGQRQRVAIARALAVGPRLLICDEPVSALDVSIQAQVVNVLRRLRDDHGMTIIFVAHDLALVRHLCDDVAVLRSGVIVEEGTAEQVMSRPHHRYTQSLLAAVPIPDPQRARQRIQRAGVPTACASE